MWRGMRTRGAGGREEADGGWGRGAQDRRLCQDSPRRGFRRQPQRFAWQRRAVQPPQEGGDSKAQTPNRSQTASIDSLSDALLALILVDFVAAGDPAAAFVLSRVCRKWRAILSGEAARVLKPLRVSQLTQAQTQSLTAAAFPSRQFRSLPPAATNPLGGGLPAPAAGVGTQARGVGSLSDEASSTRALLAQAARGGLVLDRAAPLRGVSEAASSQATLSLLELLPNTRKLLVSQTPRLFDATKAAAVWRLLERSAGSLQQLSLTEREAASLLCASAAAEATRSAAGCEGGGSLKSLSCKCAALAGTSAAGRGRVCQLLAADFPSLVSSTRLSVVRGGAEESVVWEAGRRWLRVRAAEARRQQQSEREKDKEGENCSEGEADLRCLASPSSSTSLWPSSSSAPAGASSSRVLLTLRQLQDLFVCSCAPLQLIEAPQLRRLSVSAVVGGHSWNGAGNFAVDAGGRASQCGCASLERQHLQLLIFLRRSSAQLQHLTHRLFPYRWGERCACSFVGRNGSASVPAAAAFLSRTEPLFPPPPPPPPPLSPNSLATNAAWFSEDRGGGADSANASAEDEGEARALRAAAVRAHRQRLSLLEEAFGEEREAVRRELPVELPALSFLSTHNAELLMSVRTPQLETLVLQCTTKRLSWIALLVFLASDSAHRLVRLSVLGEAAPRRLWTQTLTALKTSLEELPPSESGRVFPRQWRTFQQLLRGHAKQLLPLLAGKRKTRRRRCLGGGFSSFQPVGQFRHSSQQEPLVPFTGSSNPGADGRLLGAFSLVSLKRLSCHSELLSSLVAADALLPALSSVTVWGCRDAILDFCLRFKDSLRSLQVPRLACWCPRCLRRSSRLNGGETPSAQSFATTVGGERLEGEVASGSANASSFSARAAEAASGEARRRGVRPLAKKTHSRRPSQRVLLIQHFVGDAFFLESDLTLPRLVSLRIEQNGDCTHFLWNYLLEGDFPRLRFLFFNGRLFSHLRSRGFADSTGRALNKEAKPSSSSSSCASPAALLRVLRTGGAGSAAGTSREGRDEEAPRKTVASAGEERPSLRHLVPLPALELVSAFALDLGDLLRFALAAFERQKLREAERGDACSSSCVSAPGPLPRLRFVNASCLGGSPSDADAVFELLGVRCLGANLAFASSQATLRALTRNKPMMAVVAELCAAADDDRREGRPPPLLDYSTLFAESAQVWPWEKQTFTFFSRDNPPTWTAPTRRFRASSPSQSFSEAADVVRRGDARRKMQRSNGAAADASNARR